MMGEPFLTTIRNMEGIIKTNLDGNFMTTMAGSEDMIEGCDMEGMDGSLGVSEQGLALVRDDMGTLSSPSSPSSSVSSASTEDLSVYVDIIMRPVSRINSICGRPGLLPDGLYGKVRVALMDIKSDIMDMATRLDEAEKKNARFEQQIRRMKMERKDIERKETERKETERKEMERKELERKENVRKETERKESERKETERKESEKMEMKRKEIERKETERKMERKELEREETERKETVRKETERKELERKEMERKKMEGMEMDRKETERKETNRKERERKELERKESERMEMKRKEMERKETVKKEMERKESKRKEMERQETERKEMERKKMEKKKAGPIISEGYNIMSISPFLIGEDFPLHPLLQRDTHNFIVRNGDDRLPPVGQSPPPIINRGFEGAKTDGEACKDVILEDGIMSGSETEWRLVGGRRRGKDPLPLPPLPLTRKEPSGVMRNANMEVVNYRVERRSPSWQQPRNRPRPPSFSKEVERKESERMEMERNEIERKETDRKEVVKDGRMCDGPGDGDATIIMDWANMMYRKRKIMGKEMERKEMERKVDEDMEVAINRKERHFPIGQQRRSGPRPTLFSAVSIVGRTEGFSYAEALRNARQHIDLEALGIGMTHVKKAANGCLIEVLGEDSHRKAEVLGTRLREVLKDSARVSCPLGKKRELRITGFDESVLAEEIVRVLSSLGGCSEADVRVGPIRTLYNGLGMARVQLPAVAAAKLVDLECVRLGWTMARVEFAELRPLQCYRCWKYGHVQNMCRSTVDRRDACFKCGQSGHMVSKCQNMAHCVACYEKGLEASHRLGGPQCVTQMGKQRSTTASTNGSV